MTTAWTVVLSEEVDEWLDSLTPTERRLVHSVIERLKVQGNQLGMPLSRALGEGLYELRFTVSNTARRITYTYDPDKRIITLTTFRKQRTNERREILRARRAKQAHDETREA